MSVRKRLAVARFWYEGNAFCLMPATLEDFERREWEKGQPALESARGKPTELAAVADFQTNYADQWEVFTSRCASAMPSGPVDHTFYEGFEREVLQDLSGQEWDAIYLSLHGASITDQDRSIEVRLVKALRKQHPHTPIGASFDLHANMSPELPPLLAISATYRTHPHLDMRETAARCLENLRRTVQEEISPVYAFSNSGEWLASSNMRTDRGPMADLQKLAQDQIGGTILDIALHGGFPYSDSPNNGASVLVWANKDRASAAEVMQSLMKQYEERFAEFSPKLVSPLDGIQQALQSEGLIAITDPSDNPLSGGIGDTPGLLRALSDAHIDVRTVFASFADPDVVQSATQAGVGSAITVKLGGRLTPIYGEPVELQVSVERFTSGEFTNIGPVLTGLKVQCGPSVVLKHGFIEIIVTTHVSSCDDPGFFDLHGIDLERTRLLCAKAKNHFRAAFGSICDEIIEVNVPGPAMLDLAALKAMTKR